RRALQLAPRSVAARLEFASAAEDEGLLEDAAAIYRSLAQDPRASGRLAGGVVRQNLHRPLEEKRWDGFDSLVQPHKARPESPEWVLLAAESLLARGELLESDALLTEGCERFPKSLDLRGALAHVSIRLGDTRRAGQILDAAIAELGLNRTFV